MTDTERLARLERAFEALLAALYRRASSHGDIRQLADASADVRDFIVRGALEKGREE